MTGWKLSAKIVVPVFIRSIQHNSGPSVWLADRGQMVEEQAHQEDVKLSSDFVVKEIAESSADGSERRHQLPTKLLL